MHQASSEDPLQLTADTVASACRHAAPSPQVRLGADIPAQAGTVVAVEVLDTKSTYNQLEDGQGALRTLRAGDRVVGALGRRDALRGYAGDVPPQVRVGDTLHLLNLGGVIGRCTSGLDSLGAPVRVRVLGAVLDSLGRPASLGGPIQPALRLSPLPPLVLLAGTCMHAGKTAAACALVEGAVSRGLRVAAVKLTGVALQRDTLAMQARGAAVVATFADAGLPSTCGTDVVPTARGVLNSVAQADVDLIVAELGDGLLGSYGVRDILADPQVRAATSAVVVSANDPVAAWGAQQLLSALGHRASVITGPATDHAAGSLAIEQSTGVPARNARTESEGFVSCALDCAGLRAASPTLELAVAQ